MIHLEPGTIFAREFRVLRPLAQGGMGALYVAEQLSTGAQRALKILHPSLVSDPRNRAQFAQEARVGAVIRSPYVVEVVAAGVEESTGTPWLAMELLEGMTLDEMVRQRGRLPPAEVLGLFEQLAHALGRAHAAGIIHRDLKPENLFIAATQMLHAPSMLKVLDFGIAKLVAANQTAATATRGIGSPLWLAPEQAQAGAKLRPATDVWALGLLAYFALTGRPYWNAANVAEFNMTALLMEIAVLPLEPASVRAASQGAALPQSFDAWFFRCVARDPEARFPDGATAVAGLRALLVGAGVPPTIPLADVPPVGPSWNNPSWVTPPPPVAPPTWNNPPGRKVSAPVAVALGALGALVVAAGSFVVWKVTQRDTSTERDSAEAPRPAASRSENLPLPPMAPPPSIPTAGIVPSAPQPTPPQPTLPPTTPPDIASTDAGAATPPVVAAPEAPAAPRPRARPRPSGEGATACLGRWTGTNSSGTRFTVNVTSTTGSPCGRYESGWGTRVALTRCRPAGSGLVGDIPHPGEWTFRCTGTSARIFAPNYPSNMISLHR